MSELKPCPFCGGAGNLIGAHEDCEARFTEARVKCPKCRFEIVGAYRQTRRGWASESDYNNSEKTAVERWNRRASRANRPQGWVDKAISIIDDMQREEIIDYEQAWEFRMRARMKGADDEV